MSFLTHLVPQHVWKYGNRKLDSLRSTNVNLTLF